MIAEIEERSLNAWPALKDQHHDGWLLRFTGGYTRRANSVQAKSHVRGPLADKIIWCEEQYKARRLPTVFKITPLTQPDELDRALEERNYQRVAETNVMFASISTLPHIPLSELKTDILPREDWHDAYWRATQQSLDDRQWHQAILNAIVPAVCPVAVLDQGSPISLGLGVLERGMVGIYDLFTDERYRRQGCATRIIATILSWAMASGAQWAYLQVMSKNTSAQTLYSKLGFKSCYRYWYRVRNLGTPEEI